MEKREFSEEERAKGAYFKECMRNNNYSDIASIVSDKASFLIGLSLSWSSDGLDSNDFQRQYEMALMLASVGNKQLLDEFNAYFNARAKNYLELSDYKSVDDQQIDSFAVSLRRMYCDSASVNAMLQGYSRNRGKVKVNQ